MYGMIQSTQNHDSMLRLDLLCERTTGTCCGGDLHKQCCGVQILRSSSSSKLEVIQQELWSDIFIELPFVIQNKESHSYKQSRPNWIHENSITHSNAGKHIEQ